MSSRTANNNFRAGLFIVLTIVAGVAALVRLSGLSDAFTARTSYVVRFDLAVGASGLKSGSVVKIGGQPVGSVTAVDFVPPPRTIERLRSNAAPGQALSLPEPGTPAPPTHLYVTMQVRSDLRLFADADVTLELPLLGSVSQINIPSVGGAGEPIITNNPASVAVAPPRVLEAWDLIDGQLAPPTFLAQAGYGDEQKTQLQQILQRGSEIGAQVQSLVKNVQTRADPTLASLNQAADNVRDITATVNADVPGWARLITESLVNTRSATANADQRLLELRAAIGFVQATIEKNEPFLSAIFANTAELTSKANGELFGIIRDTLLDGRRAVGDVADLSARARVLATEAQPELRQTLANARLASDQLRLAMVEIRRNPWRLLYQPTKRELEEELTFDAARTYAQAVSNLRSASESLEALLASAQARGGADEAARARLAEMTEQLNQAFARYQDAERSLLDRLLRRDP